MGTLYNPNGQLSFVGYPAQEFSQPYVQVREGASLRYTYRNGYMASAIRGDIAENFLTVTERYADGTIARSNNTLAKSDRNYDFMGRQIGSLLYDIGSTTPKQTGTFSYDELGNLKIRSQSGVQTWGESFTYDNLNRLLTVTSTTNGIAGKTYSYSADGNLTGKNLTTAVGGSTTNLGAGLPGTIAYGTTARPNGAGPHAVASANVGAGGAAKTFAYDANGNFTGYTDGTRTLTYTPFNLPATITGTNPQIPDLGQASYSYQYDGDHARVKETYTAAGVPASGGGAGSTTTVYVGNGFFERVENADGSTEYRNYLSGPDGTLGLWSVNNGLGAIRFWHKDHLGSPILEYGIGGPETQFGFDPWGLRRKGDHTDAGALTKEDLSTSGTYSAHFTPRGFTGHQHLDGLGLIHMNGRIYDPVIGRFLQADPIVQEPFNGQNFNRYTYVLNNPLAYTDPTGYSFWTEVRRPVGAIVAMVVTFGLVRGEMIAAASAMGPPTEAAIAAANATAAVASGFAAGGIAGGNIESAVLGAMTGGMLNAVGAAGLPWYEKALAHAIIGCAGAGVNGDCGRNALAGGFSSLAGSALSMNDLKAWDNMATRAVIGGASSALAGGKFANGAFTAAFNYLLNDWLHAQELSREADAICAARSGPTLACSNARAAADEAFKNVPNEQAIERVTFLEEALAGGGIFKALGRAMGALFPTKAAPKLLNQFDSAESLIKNAGTLERLKGGAKMGTVTGDGEAIFKAISNGGQTLPSGYVKMADGTIIGKHIATSTGQFTIDINQAGQIFKIRVNP